MNKRYSITKETKFKTRAEQDNLYIDGYFAVFNSKYELWDGAFETILPGAFDGELENDIRALTNHDTTLVLGRTNSGTLKLSVDEVGLFGSILVNQNDGDAMNLYERVKRGDVNQCSFGFDIVEQETVLDDFGIPIEWRIKKVKLYEVSVCTFPAYKETSVEARKEDFELIKKKQNEIWINKMKGILKKGKIENA